MRTDSIAIDRLPHTTRLFRDYVESSFPLTPFYSSTAFSDSWRERPLQDARADAGQIAALLEKQNRNWGAGDKTLSAIESLRKGARAVVTGQQATLFGGPLYSLLKAATAIALAREASAAGAPHVPVFWLATEDHDLAEINQWSVPWSANHEHDLRTLQIEGLEASGFPTGSITPGAAIIPLVEKVKEIVGDGFAADLLERCYSPERTFGESFARLFTTLFAEHGLILMDAAGGAFHQLGKPVLSAAIAQASQLNGLLLNRNQELQHAGYHAQVLVKESSSLLFWIDDQGQRKALKLDGEGGFRSGNRSFSADELLNILDAAPERISSNALLRPVFQDFLLPTSVYVGGPAEVAYFAQSEVLYQEILRRVTPITPRFSATLVEPGIRRVLDRQGLDIEDVWVAEPVLLQRFGARHLPLEGKQTLAAAGNELDRELSELVAWMNSLDASLGRSAKIASSKMLYQMNRLRRMAANFSLQKEGSLAQHARLLSLNLFPDGGLPERVFGSMYFVARHGQQLIDLLVEQASGDRSGHGIVIL